MSAVSGPVVTTVVASLCRHAWRSMVLDVDKIVSFEKKIK
jgi:hypothetical protein